MQTQAQECAFVGGVVDSDLLCWLSNITTGAACLPPSFCADSDGITCGPYCYFDNIPEATCNCSTTVSQAQAVCSTLRWDSAKGRCVSDLLLEECVAATGAFWHGAKWQEGVLATPADCAVGYCPDLAGPADKVQSVCSRNPHKTNTRHPTLTHPRAHDLRQRLRLLATLCCRQVRALSRAPSPAAIRPGVNRTVRPICLLPPRLTFGSWVHRSGAC